MNIVLPLLTILSAVNLVLLAIYGWFFRKNEKPFFWLGCMNISIAVTIIDNLLIYYHSTHVLFYHFSFIINMSWGAYFINLLSTLKNNKPNYRKQCLLFLPSILYVIFTIYTFIIPEYNNLLLQSIYENKPLLANIIPNFVLLIYSLGANLFMLTIEIYQRKTEAGNVFRKRRIEILISFIFFQSITFLPYVISQSIIYLIFLMPVVSFLTYLWIFFRLQHILNVREIILFNKYKNIKISDLEKKDMADKIEKHLRDNKPFLEPKYSINDLAKELNLPIIFHCRMAHDELIEILGRYDGKLQGAIHCFSGDWQQAEKYLDMGFYLGFNGIIFKLNLDEVIEKIPLDKVLIETDCPYLTPFPMTGRNEPIYVKYVAERIAKIRKLSYEEILEATTENAKKLFNI